MMLTQDDYNQCLATISKVVEEIDADFIDIGGDNNKKKGGHLMIRKRLTSVEDLLEIRVAVVGNVVIENGRREGDRETQYISVLGCREINYIRCTDKGYARRWPRQGTGELV